VVSAESSATYGRSLKFPIDNSDSMHDGTRKTLQDTLLRVACKLKSKGIFLHFLDNANVPGSYLDTDAVTKASKGVHCNGGTPLSSQVRAKIVDATIIDKDRERPLIVVAITSEEVRTVN
jgi:hypothetical protein